MATKKSKLEDDLKGLVSEEILEELNKIKNNLIAFNEHVKKDLPKEEVKRLEKILKIFKE